MTVSGGAPSSPPPFAPQRQSLGGGHRVLPGRSELDDAELVAAGGLYYTPTKASEIGAELLYSDPQDGDSEFGAHLRFRRTSINLTSVSNLCPADLINPPGTSCQGGGQAVA